MLGDETQSGSGDVIDAIGSAVAGVPWMVVVLLIVIILSGVVLLIMRVRGNSQGPGWDLDPGKRPGDGRKP